MRRHWWRAILVGAVFLSGVLGNWNDTSTGIDLDKLRQFTLSRIRSGELKDGSRVAFDGMTAVTGGKVREVVLRGVGKLGKRWEAHFCCLDEVWRADLDGNGTQDYIFFGSGPYYNGRTTPPFSLSILLMDSEGVPVPFFTVAYHGENGAGIKHLVDLNHDGHAELLISTYDEITSDARVGAFCSGHWTTQLYGFKNLGVEEIRGTIGGRSFPFIHDWTYRGTECAENETPFSSVRPAALYEHGTSTQREVITTFGKSDDIDGLLAIEPVSGCKAIDPRVIVYDRPHIRKIAFPNPYSTFNLDLIDAIERHGAHVKLRGIDKWMGNGGCSVNLMWAG